MAGVDVAVAHAVRRLSPRATIQQVAASAALSRSTVERALAQLRDDGVVMRSVAEVGGKPRYVYCWRMPAETREDGRDGAPGAE